MTPALELLLGPQAAEVLAAAIAEYRGELTALAPVNVHVQPSGAVAVRYRAEVHRGDGRRSMEMLVATTADRIPPGATVVAGEHRGQPVEVGVWRWPQDPALPGLDFVRDPARAAAALRDHGLTTAPAVRMTVRGYRPGRRAVIELRDGQRRWFVKVVRPAAARALIDRHELLSAHVPVPPVLLSTDDGVLVLPEAPGTPLRTLIADDAALPTPDTLAALLDALPTELSELPRRRTQLQGASDSSAILRQTTAGRDDLLGMVDEVADRLRTAPPHSAPTVPVHGDFYEGQLLADGGRVTGLLDVDTAGPGERADDWATLIGHLVVAAHTYPAADRYAQAVLDHADRRHDGADLRRRVAAVLLGLATGPFRTQHPHWADATATRLELARRWLAQAE